MSFCVNPVSMFLLGQQMPNAAWAWEFLRRNPNYICDWNSLQKSRLESVELVTGGSLIRASQRDLLAEKWGLLFMANPALDAKMANVFWQPSVFPAALQVFLKPFTSKLEDESGRGILNLQTRRVSYNTLDGTRHILLCGDRFWIQLFCKDCKLTGENVHIEFHINPDDGAERRLDTAAQLLSLYRSSGRKLALIGRKKNSQNLAEALVALDINANS
ncbi:MAG: hypothetical protein COB36_13150 [Alphaproteobacteria bacterium]|nr:MAG: hypothetical protein COB36_13150 [Alphaproteobacteria bacterium]